MDRTGIIEIENFWDSRSCQQAIAKAEAEGFDHATVSTELGEKFALHARNNRRVISKDPELANEIWSILSEQVPSIIGNSAACGLNELLRYYKYEAGQKFQRHRDQSFIRDEFEASCLTVLIYLNENFEGGETSFPDMEVVPKTGKCVVFPHQIEHEGSEVYDGIKYVLRTDVMFRLSR